MRRCEDEIQTPILEEPCAQTLSGKTCLARWDNQSPTFVKICHRLCRRGGNSSPVLGTSATHFGKNNRKISHRLREIPFSRNPSPIFGKSVTDFGEIRHRLWGNPSPTLGKSARRIFQSRWQISPKSVADFPNVGG